MSAAGPIAKPRDLSKEGREAKEARGGTIREEAIDRYLQLEKQKRYKKHACLRFCLYCVHCDNNIRYVIFNLRILTSSEKFRAHIDLQAYQNMSSSMFINPKRRAYNC
jgi:hypothetical protein